MDLYEMPVRRYSSKKCNTWTTEMYSIKQDGRLGPAVCNQCEKISNHIEWSLSNEPLTSTVPVLEVEVKAETGESCGETHEGEEPGLALDNRSWDKSSKYPLNLSKLARTKT